jgi:phosphatidylinositol glycan class U
VAHFLSKANALKRTLPLLAAHQSILLAVSYFLTGSLTFLRTYSAMVTVQDLTPNIGLYWYIFIEMFEHFRNFFLLVFQAHLVCYAVPVCLKLQYARQDP